MLRPPSSGKYFIFRVSCDGFLTELVFIFVLSRSLGGSISGPWFSAMADTCLL